MEMRLRTPVTRGYFFLLGALRLVNAASPRTISVHKKKISSGTQGTSLSFLPLVPFSPLPPVLLPVPLFSFHSVYLLSIPDVLASSFSYASIVIINMKTSKGNYFNFN